MKKKLKTTITLNYTHTYATAMDVWASLSGACFRVWSFVSKGSQLGVLPYLCVLVLQCYIPTGIANIEYEGAVRSHCCHGYQIKRSTSTGLVRYALGSLCLPHRLARTSYRWGQRWLGQTFSPVRRELTPFYTSHQF